MIGAGLGGLALALRLQAAGLATSLIEARGEVGGIIRRLDYKGFAFEEGPSLLADPASFDELLALGTLPVEQHDWTAVDPAFRFLWSDGTSFDACGDPALLVRQFARLAPQDAGALDEWQSWGIDLKRRGWPELVEARKGNLLGLARAAPTLLRDKAWQTAWRRVSGIVAEPHLAQALSFPALLAGGNPMSASGHLLAGQPMAGQGPGWWPRGGMAALARRMADRFVAMGGDLRLHDPVVRIRTLGNRASEIETLGGWQGQFAAVAATTDPVHLYRELLRDTPHAGATATKLSGKPFSPSALTVHFALAGSWPGIPHQTILLGARFAELLADIFDHGVLPRDMMIWLHHPTVTEPDLAPAGHSLMRATIPVAHLGKLPVDWEVLGPTIAERVLREVGRRMIPDIGDRILAFRVTTPRDLSLDLGLHMGSGWSFEPRLTPQGLLRLDHRDRKLANLYLAGAATHPGAGVAGVLAGAKACAQSIIGEVQ